MSELHLINQVFPEPRIVLTKLSAPDSNGFRLVTSKNPIDLTDEALHAVAGHLYDLAVIANQDWYGLVYTLVDGRELQLQVHIKEAEE